MITSPKQTWPDNSRAEAVMHAIIAARKALLTTYRDQHETGGWPDLIMKADNQLATLEREARTAARNKKEIEWRNK